MGALENQCRCLKYAKNQFLDFRGLLSAEHFSTQIPLKRKIYGGVGFELEVHGRGTFEVLYGPAAVVRGSPPLHCVPQFLILQ